MPNELVLESETKDALEIAKGFVINSNDAYLVVDRHCAGLLQLKKKIEADFADPKKKSYETWKAIVAQEKGHLDGVDEARGICKNKMDRWNRDQEEIRRKEEERLRQEAQKKADDEAIAAAEAAEKRGEKEEAEAIISTPVQVAPIVVPKSTPKTSTVVRKVWKFRVTNPNLIPRQFLVVDTVKVGGVVRSLGANHGIPGVEAYQEAC